MPWRPENGPLTAAFRVVSRIRLLRRIAVKIVRSSGVWSGFLKEHDRLVTERNELKRHCERLERQLAEQLRREAQLGSENDALLKAPLHHRW